MYDYRLLEVVRVVDGDTFDVRIDLGFGSLATMRFRLAKIDTPEMRGSTVETSGPAAREFAVGWFAARPPKSILVRTYKGSQSTVGIGDGAFGRWLASFQDLEGCDLATDLAAAGFTKPT